MSPSPTPPGPIPVQGDVQIFADAECSSYPSGATDTVYARINVPWVGVNSGWSVPYFEAQAPTTEDPDDNYGIIWLVDFASTIDGPYSVGQVIQLKAVDVFNVVSPFIFSKP